MHQRIDDANVMVYYEIINSEAEFNEWKAGARERYSVIGIKAL